MSDEGGHDPLVDEFRREAAEIRSLVASIKRTNGNGVHVPKWVVQIAGPLLTAILLGMGGMVLSLHNTVSTIESNRFTDTQASEMRRQLEREIASHERVGAHDVADQRITVLEGYHR